MFFVQDMTASEHVVQPGPVGFACCWDLRQTLMPPPVHPLPHQLIHSFLGIARTLVELASDELYITPGPCHLGLASSLPYLGVHQ